MADNTKECIGKQLDEIDGALDKKIRKLLYQKDLIDSLYRSSLQNFKKILGEDRRELLIVFEPKN